MAVQRYLAMLTTLALTGCGAMPGLSLPDVKARNDFKGKPLSAVTTQLGYPDYQQTYAGQKTYTWRRGTAAQECLIKVVMAGDIVESLRYVGRRRDLFPLSGPRPARFRPMTTGGLQ